MLTQKVVNFNNILFSLRLLLHQHHGSKRRNIKTQESCVRLWKSIQSAFPFFFCAFFLLIHTPFLSIFFVVGSSVKVVYDTAHDVFKEHRVGEWWWHESCNDVLYATHDVSKKGMIFRVVVAKSKKSKERKKNVKKTPTRHIAWSISWWYNCAQWQTSVGDTCWICRSARNNGNFI